MVTVTAGWVKDRCDGAIGAGDVVIATFRGEAGQRFEIEGETGTGMVMVRRPDGSTSPMRPSTILACAERVERKASG